MFCLWKVEGDNIDCIFHCIIMFCFCYSMILTLSATIGTLCYNGQGPCELGFKSLAECLEL
jgi:hypothetical protein